MSDASIQYIPDVEQALLVLLKQNALLQQKLSGQLYENEAASGWRIWPDVLAQAPKLPALVFFEVGEVPLSTTAGPGISRSRIQFDAYSQYSQEAFDLIRAVDSVICPRQTEASPGFQRIVTLSDGSKVNVQGAIPAARRSFYESATKLYRRGRDYVVFASSVT